jgi:hypothetical protein
MNLLLRKNDVHVDPNNDIGPQIDPYFYPIITELCIV